LKDNIEIERNKNDCSTGNRPKDKIKIETAHSPCKTGSNLKDKIKIYGGTRK